MTTSSLPIHVDQDATLSVAEFVGASERAQLETARTVAGASTTTLPACDRFEALVQLQVTAWRISY